MDEEARGRYHVLRVLIASPGDAVSGRDAVERCLYAWNGDQARDTSVALLPSRWETDAVPLLGAGDAQSVINSQLVDEADVVIAIFYNRLGRATARAASGTAEEIRRSVARGKFVHIFFSNMLRRSDISPEQLLALQEFRSHLEAQGLVATFDSELDLQAKVQRALNYDVRINEGAMHECPRRAIGHTSSRTRV